MSNFNLETREYCKPKSNEEIKCENKFYDFGKTKIVKIEDVHSYEDVMKYAHDISIMSEFNNRYLSNIKEMEKIYIEIENISQSNLEQKLKEELINARRWKLLNRYEQQLNQMMKSIDVEMDRLKYA